MKHKCTNKDCDYYNTSYFWNCSKIQDVEACKDAVYGVVSEDGDMKRYRINATLCTTKHPSMPGTWL